MAAVVAGGVRSVGSVAGLEPQRPGASVVARASLISPAGAPACTPGWPVVGRVIAAIINAPQKGRHVAMFSEVWKGAHQ